MTTDVAVAGQKVAEGAKELAHEFHSALKRLGNWTETKFRQVGEHIREGYEDSMAWISEKAAIQANKTANVAPRVDFNRLPDYPAGALPATSKQ